MNKMCAHGLRIRMGSGPHDVLPVEQEALQDAWWPPPHDTRIMPRH